MPVEQVKFYQDHFGNGFSVNELVTVMENGFPSYTHSMWESPSIIQYDDETKRILYTIFSSIPSGMAAIGGIRRYDGSAHCIMFAVSDTNTNSIPMVLDAQVGKVYYGESSILTDWLSNDEPNISNMYILNSINPDGLQLILDINGNEITASTPVVT